MSLCIRIALRLRQAAAGLERIERRSRPRRHGWEINRGAKQFVADHAHLTIDELTDLAIKRGIYSARLPRKNIAWKMHWLRTMRVLPPPSLHPSAVNL